MRLLITSLICFLSTAAVAKMLTSADVDAAAQAMLSSKKYVGFSVMVVSPTDEIFMSYGESSLGSGLKATEKTIYEIASNTKAMTGLLAAQMILEGKVKDTDIVQNILGEKKLSQKNPPLQLKHLLTQSSGILTFYTPESYAAPDPLNPWKGYDSNELYPLLETQELHFVPGTQYEYSNLGAAVAGYVLEVVDGKPYDEIVSDRIATPLGLKDTTIFLSDEEQTSRMAKGYLNDNGNFLEVPKWDMSGVPAAGAVVSTPNDLKIYVRALLDENSALGKAFDLAAQPNMVSAIPGMSIGYFWHVSDHLKFAWHNGATYGMSSFIGVSKDKKVAVIVLANTWTQTNEETILGMTLMSEAVSK